MILASGWNDDDEFWGRIWSCFSDCVGARRRTYRLFCLEKFRRAPTGSLFWQADGAAVMNFGVNLAIVILVVQGHGGGLAGCRTWQNPPCPYETLSRRMERR